MKTIDWRNAPEIPKEEKERRIRVIEARGKDEVYRVLKMAGIKRNSGNWKDYSTAKRLLFGGMWINSEIYDRQIQWITNYLAL